MRKTVIATLALSLLLLGAFQNCGKLGFSTDNASSAVNSLGISSNSANSANGSLDDDDGPPVTSGTGADDSPALAVNSHPRHPLKGQSTVVTAFPQNLDSLSYSCSPTADPSQITASGKLGSDQMMFKLVVDRDVVCTFKGDNAKLEKSISVPFEIDVQCGAQSKNTAGACEDSVCKSYQELDADVRGQWNDVPARTDDGVCYYKKIVNGLVAGPSDPNAKRDDDVLARDRDGADAAGRAPRVMASFLGSFRLRGPRSVKLTSAPDSAAPLTVDDLLIVGVYPQDVAPDLSSDYQARGSAPASLLKDGVDTGGIVFKGTPLSLQRTADDAPLSIPTVEVTSFAEVRRRQTLDVRAEDTGGTQGLSDIYVLFQ